MATIKVCDWPGCGAALSEYPDRFNLRFEHAAIRAMTDQYDSGGPFTKVERDPDPISKDLCRPHSTALHDYLTSLFFPDA